MKGTIIIEQSGKIQFSKLNAEEVESNFDNVALQIFGLYKAQIVEGQKEAVFCELNAQTANA